MSHPDLDATRREFALQSGPMDRGATFNAREAIDPFVRLLGDPVPDPVLDLACGPGILTQAVARAGSHVDAFDATAEMLAAARRRCAGLDRVGFHEGDAARLPFEDGHFAGAVTRLSLHHFPDPSGPLAEVRRVLRSGAPLVVGDIVASEDAEEARIHNALEKLRDPTHCRLLPESELFARLEGAGFRIDRVEPWANPKTFSDWAAIVGEARDIEPVGVVMAALARAGVHAGFGLSVDEEVHFVHHWRFVRAIAV